MKLFGVTHRGVVRKQNQDAYFYWTDGEMGCAVVCDGMGGARSGNIASALAAETFAQLVGRSVAEPQQRLSDGAAAANQRVFQRAQRDESCMGMGTTLVAALALDHVAHIINVGDSRCYRIHEGEITQLTRDHSLVAELLAMGRITEEEAEHHPHKNIITRALGTESHTEGDLYRVELAPGDQLLFCSDGLSNLVRPEEMEEMCQKGTLEERCRRMLRAALDRGAPDNVTVVMMETENKGEGLWNDTSE